MELVQLPEILFLALHTQPRDGVLPPVRAQGAPLLSRVKHFEMGLVLVFSFRRHPLARLLIIRKKNSVPRKGHTSKTLHSLSVPPTAFLTPAFDTFIRMLAITERRRGRSTVVCRSSTTIQ